MNFFNLSQLILSSTSNSVCLHCWLHGSHVAGERHVMAAGLRQASSVGRQWRRCCSWGRCEEGPCYWVSSCFIGFWTSSLLLQHVTGWRISCWECRTWVVNRMKGDRVWDLQQGGIRHPPLNQMVKLEFQLFRFKESLYRYLYHIYLNGATGVSTWGGIVYLFIDLFVYYI